MARFGKFAKAKFGWHLPLESIGRSFDEVFATSVSEHSGDVHPKAHCWSAVEELKAIILQTQGTRFGTMQLAARPRSVRQIATRQEICGPH
jgi:hypothetical protein